MPSQITSPSTDDCATVPWQRVIDEAASPECFAYCGVYCKKAAEAEEACHDVALNVYAFFARLTCLAFRLDDPVAPLGPEDRLDSFTDGELAVLDTLVSGIADPELQARIADLLWLRNHGEGGKRDYRNAQLAVGAYIASALRLESPQEWTHCVDRAERALQIASSLGRTPKNRHYADVIGHIEEVLNRYHGDDPLYLTARMMELLLTERRGDPTKYAFLAEKAARQAEADHDWWRAREYWKLNARWHELRGGDQEQRLALIAAGETYISNGKDRLQGDHPDYLAAVAFYNDGITAFRRIGGMQERCEQLHRVLLELQAKSVSTMGHFSASFEIPKAEELVEQARSEVRGKPAPEALTALALVSASPSVRSIQRSIEEVRKNSPIFALFPRVLVNQRGRTQKRVPDSSPDADSSRIALETDMFEYAVNSRRVIVLTAILPAVEQVNLEHSIRIRDLALLVFNNPFVPVGREGIFARGLHSGLIGDFLVACHLLIPQLEHSVRVLLESRGVLVSGLDEDGSQPERGLNTTLERPEAQEFFGKDLTFDLRGLLVEKAGSNMRHGVAHGLLDERTFQTTEAVYLWWVTLRICVLAAAAVAAMPAEQSPKQSE